MDDAVDWHRGVAGQLAADIASDLAQGFHRVFTNSIRLENRQGEEAGKPETGIQEHPTGERVKI
jgi:hypothetical protein